MSTPRIAPPAAENGVTWREFDHATQTFGLATTGGQISALGVSSERAETEKSVRWARDFWGAMQPHSTRAVYVNYLGLEADEDRERIKAAYGPEKHARLVALKNKYDPDNLFRLNQNIEPSQATAKTA